MTSSASCARAFLLPPPPGGHARGWAEAHAAVMPFVPVQGPYRFTWVDGPIGARDAVDATCQAAYRTLGEAPSGGAITLVAAFREPAGDAALFDALLWGHCEAMRQVDLLRYPRMPGPEGSLSLGGRVALPSALHAQAARRADRAPHDTLVLRFAPVALTAGWRVP